MKADDEGSPGVPGSPRVKRDVLCDEGFSLDDLLVELGRLEEKAIRRKVHGR
jgi:hypothetical protein